MRVTVKIFGHLRRLLEREKTVVELAEGSDLRALMGILLQSSELRDTILHEEGELWDRIAILKNGRHVLALRGLATTLEEGDEIVIVPPSGGG